MLRAAPALVVALLAGAACGSGESAVRARAPSGDWLETPPPGALPSFATERGPRVAEAYRYAVDQREALQYIPCYCGCGGHGHASNYDCYVYAVGSQGRVTYNAHAAG